MLLTTYTTIGLILTELPCGYTAAFGVCLAMAVQECTLNTSTHLYMEHKNRLHAFVGSILSLVCHIHDAKIFYKYIGEIIKNRSNYAPHLNPPLRWEYKYADDYLILNQEKLFFDDWEARYGLWKNFRITHKYNL